MAEKKKRDEEADGPDPNEPKPTATPRFTDRTAPPPPPAKPGSRAGQSSMSDVPWSSEAHDATRAKASEKAALDAESRLMFQPWMKHNSKSTLSLGDAAALSRMMREDGLTKEQATRKLLWQKDQRKTPATAGDAAREMVKSK